MGYVHNCEWSGCESVMSVCLVFLHVYVGILFCFGFSHLVVLMVEMMNLLN